jgi:hypothetical protein
MESRGLVVIPAPGQRRVKGVRGSPGVGVVARRTAVSHTGSVTTVGRLKLLGEA